LAEPVFERPDQHGEGYWSALDLLLDAYDELGWSDKKLGLLVRVSELAPPFLAAVAWRRMATIASADDCCRWELKVKRKAILSDNFEVELWAHFPDDKYAFADGVVDILSDDIEWISTETCGIPHGPGTTAGTARTLVGSISPPPAAPFAWA